MKKKVHSFTINYSALRGMWFEAAKQTSLGILLYSFTDQGFNHRQTLGKFLAGNPKINRRFQRWVRSKNSRSFVLTGAQLAYMLRW